MSQDDKPKLCVDCRWHSMARDQHDCLAPQNSGISMVTGKPERRFCSCRFARASMTGCGVAGAWWQAKESEVTHA